MSVVLVCVWLSGSILLVAVGCKGSTKALISLICIHDMVMKKHHRLNPDVLDPTLLVRPNTKAWLLELSISRLAIVLCMQKQCTFITCLTKVRHGQYARSHFTGYCVVAASQTDLGYVLRHSSLFRQGMASLH